ncbi:MAG: UbiA family prenyltransferase, partial [Planctomycetota bacterium]
MPTSLASRLFHWAQLVRLPNVFTILADITASFILVAGGVQPVTRWLTVLVSGVCLYWAGMVLNDCFDVEKDRRERSSRPLAAGHISLKSAWTAGWGLLVVGVALAAASGWVPESRPGESIELVAGQASATDVASEPSGTWVPGIVGMLLAATIVGYDGPLKRTVLAPAAMGFCRSLSFILGASPLVGTLWISGETWLELPPRTLLVAAGFGVYITGITLIARREATGGRSIHLPVGFALVASGALLLSIAPMLGAQWAESVRPIEVILGPFQLLILLIAGPVMLRSASLLRDPRPAAIQNTIRAGIQAIIPLAARYDLAALRQACLDHPLPGTRKLMIEYVVLPGVNDGDAEIDGLAAWTRDLPCLVNLIPFNPFVGAPYRAPTADDVRRVGARLQAHKVPH